jgi:hypothetical protein
VATESAVTRPAARPRPSAVLVLGVLALLTFALIPIQISTIYSGLPAHPLFLHVPVILIPVATIAAVVLAARPAWLDRHGVWVTAVAVVALGATNLTMGAGKALRNDLGLGPGGRVGGFGGLGFGGGPEVLIARHEHAADILRILLILFTALLIVVLAVYRADTGITPLDGILTRVRSLAGATLMLRVGLVVLALASLYFVFHTGDLGAKAVWQGRLHPAPPSFGGGGFGGGG